MAARRRPAMKTCVRRAIGKAAARAKARLPARGQGPGAALARSAMRVHATRPPPRPAAPATKEVARAALARPASPRDGHVDRRPGPPRRRGDEFLLTSRRLRLAEMQRRGPQLLPEDAHRLVPGLKQWGALTRVQRGVDELETIAVPAAALHVAGRPRDEAPGRRTADASSDCPGAAATSST